MKKLIALTFCLVAAAVAVRAEYPKTEYPQQAPKNVQQSVDNRVEAAQRKVTMNVYAASDPREAAQGTAYILGFGKNFTEMTLLTNQSLATDIDILGDDYFLAKVTQGTVTHQAAEKVLKIQAVNPGINQHYYQVTVPVKLTDQKLTAAKQIKNITATQLLDLLK
ncbi:MAG: hypothetical protein IJ876_04085 [Elusimicrobiaceae bacterium]|nr:hypothetical protein [Elusimicrobiaceae bacterium]